MVIYQAKIPIYGIFIVISLLCGLVYGFFKLKKENVSKDHIALYFLIILAFSIIGGKLMTLITTDNESTTFLSAGLSSYGGAIGIIMGIIYYEMINPHNKLFIKTAIMPLPLIYGVAKLGCFFAGCCYGMPYNGILSVTYPDGLNIPLFPIQLLESIVFILLFILLQHINKKHPKYIIEITIIVCAFAKFILDFLRYIHLDQIISINQIVSLLFILLAALSTYKKWKKTTC